MKSLNSGFMNETMSIKWKLCASVRTILFLFFSLWLWCFLCIVWGLISSLWHTADTLTKPQTSHQKFHWGVALGRLTTTFLFMDLASVLDPKDWCLPKLHLRLDAMKHSFQTGEEGWVWQEWHRKTPTRGTSYRISDTEWHQHQESCHLSVPGSCAVSGMHIRGNSRISSEHAARWHRWMNTLGRQKLCWFKLPSHWVSISCSRQLWVG